MTSLRTQCLGVGKATKGKKKPQVQWKCCSGTDVSNTTNTLKKKERCLSNGGHKQAMAWHT